MAQWVALVSSLAAVVSAIIAFFAVRYSRSVVHAAREQASAAIGANDFARQVGQSQAVVHFTGRFFDLLSDGPRFGDAKWEYQFWSLHATEFYFFDNSWVPGFMYQLWMVELAAMYRTPEVRESHARYLQAYSGNYARMCDFFDEVQEVARRHDGDASSRNRKVASVVEHWEKRTR